MIYPLISLAYIWVTVCPNFIFHDTLNWLNVIGICSVILGVGVLGRQKKE